MARGKNKNKESLLEKAVDAVDHLLHPDAPATGESQQSEPGDEVENPAPAEKVSSQQEQDLKNHPKFDKFKSHGGEN